MPYLIYFNDGSETRRVSDKNMNVVNSRFLAIKSVTEAGNDAKVFIPCHRIQQVIWYEEEENPQQEG